MYSFISIFAFIFPFAYQKCLLEGERERGGGDFNEFRAQSVSFSSAVDKNIFECNSRALIHKRTHAYNAKGMLIFSPLFLETPF